MVEFGLKLEDNKVSEWSDKYIDYEMLKRILKKASEAIKRKDELCKRKPILAEEIVAAYKQGNGPNLMSPSSSQIELMGDTIQEEEEPVVDQVPAAAESETKPLLTKSDTHASHGTIASQTVDSLSGHISRTISGYFSNSKYEQRIREALDEIENLESRFDETIQQELPFNRSCEK